MINPLYNALLNLFRPLGFIKTLFRSKHDDFVEILIAGNIERLREFGSISIDRDSLDHVLPCRLVYFADFSGRGCSRHVDRF